MHLCLFVCSCHFIAWIAIIAPHLWQMIHFWPIICFIWKFYNRIFLQHPTRPMIDSLVPYDFLIDLWRDNLSDDIYVVLRYGVRFPPNINGYTDCRKINNWTVQIYSKAQNRGRHTIIHFRRLSDPLIDHKSNRSENRGFYDAFLWLIIISYRALRS